MANQCDVNKRYLSILVPHELVAKLDQLTEDARYSSRTELCWETLEKRVESVVLSPARQEQVIRAIKLAKRKRMLGEIDDEF